MSEKPIAVGDLVQVVRPAPCCGTTRGMGIIFTVSGLEPFPRWCQFCFQGEWKSALGYGTPVRVDRLRRIPPMPELEGERTEEQLREPA